MPVQDRVKTSMVAGHPGRWLRDRLFPFPGRAARRDRRIVRLRPFGMFSNVCEVVQHLYNAERDGYTFDIQWDTSPYLDPAMGPEPWNYYFEQPFRPTPTPPDDAMVLPGGRDVVCRSDSIITPCRVDFDHHSMYLPADTSEAHRIIRRFLRLTPQTQSALTAARQQLVQGPTIGVHMRGPAGTDGGNRDARAAHGSPGAVPYALFQRHIDAALASRPDARILLCTDDADVIDHMRLHYGSKIATYDAFRLPAGEMHTRIARGEAMAATPYRLGLDVVIEAYLLGDTDILIHDFSNVSRFVRCLTPGQPKVCVYD